MSISGNAETKLVLPTSATFSFTLPGITSSTTTPSTQAVLKQRRVSLALPSSPRVVQAWSFRDDTGLEARGSSAAPASPEKKGKMRKISVDDTEIGGSKPRALEKRQRKKWTEEETQMLVNGCNTWGVGNWKAILNDPDLKFDNRSPVDLKDRFRTFFPDAYKVHYPNAKTHLSSKVRSTLPDGSPLFEKTRSKKRRPFTEEEDRALKAGYDKYGTLWSQIVKDPIFMEQKRRSTDLRDRFRNAFPELYQAAGYKPRPVPKKKRPDVYPTALPSRATVDDQLLPTRLAAPPLRRRAKTNPNCSRSAPHSTVASEDEDTSGGEEDSPPVPSTSKSTQESTPVSALAEDLNATSDFPMSDLGMVEFEALCDSQSRPITSSQNSFNSTTQSTAHSSGRESPLFYEGGWASTAPAASPTSSQLSHLSGTDFMANDSQMHRMIGKSGWGTSEWLSANPRMDPNTSISSSSSFVDASPVPSSPFSFSNISHGIMDRYDLFPTSFAHDISSEVGFGDTHSAFSDPEMFSSQTFRGFTHHSDYAGDLIFGTRSHQPQNQNGYTAMNGLNNFSGLGLSGMTQQPPPPASINPIQLHTPMLPGIDEIELSSISLDDHVENDDNMIDGPHINMDKESTQLGLDSGISQLKAMIENLNEIGNEMSLNPPDTPVRASRPLREVGEQQQQQQYPNNHNRSSSVPPSEHRVPLPPSRSHQLFTHVMPMPPMRSFSQASHDALNSHFGILPPSMPSSAGNPNISKATSDPHTLSFLDMHYFNSGVGMSALHHEIEKLGTSPSRHGQALDLAQINPTLSAHPVAAQPATVSPGQLINSLNSLNAAVHRPYVNHNRVQSAVSPKDLLLNSGNENKRKRVSWDGTSG